MSLRINFSLSHCLFRARSLSRFFVRPGSFCGRLVSIKVGLALFDERARGLAMVLGGERHHLIGERRIEDQVGLLLEPLVDRELAPSDRIVGPSANSCANSRAFA